MTDQQTEKKPQAPFLNINGTSYGMLMEGYRQAYVAINAAIEKIAAIAPHGRDYQTVANNYFTTAQIEHVARLRKLEEIKADLESLVQQIDDQHYQKKT